jgi:hypothetical protein
MAMRTRVDLPSRRDRPSPAASPSRKADSRPGSGTWSRGNLCGAGVVLAPFQMPAFYTAGMSEDTRPGKDEAQHEERPALPKHLSALVGSLRGPADLGRNHDKYLTCADREEAGGAASA